MCITFVKGPLDQIRQMRSLLLFLVAVAAAPIPPGQDEVLENLRNAQNEQREWFNDPQLAGVINDNPSTTSDHLEKRQTSTTINTPNSYTWPNSATIQPGLKFLYWEDFCNFNDVSSYFNMRKSLQSVVGTTATTSITLLDSIAAVSSSLPLRPGMLGSSALIGFFKPISATSITITITFDQGFAIWVGETAINPWIAPYKNPQAFGYSPGTATIAITGLSASNYYPIRIHHGNCDTISTNLVITFSSQVNFYQPLSNTEWAFQVAFTIPTLSPSTSVALPPNVVSGLVSYVYDTLDYDPTSSSILVYLLTFSEHSELHRQHLRSIQSAFYCIICFYRKPWY